MKCNFSLSVALLYKVAEQQSDGVGAGCEDGAHSALCAGVILWVHQWLHCLVTFRGRLNQYVSFVDMILLLMWLGSDWRTVEYSTGLVTFTVICTMRVQYLFPTSLATYRIPSMPDTVDWWSNSCLETVESRIVNAFVYCLIKLYSLFLVLNTLLSGQDDDDYCMFKKNDNINIYLLIITHWSTLFHILGYVLPCLYHFTLCTPGCKYISHIGYVSLGLNSIVLVTDTWVPVSV